MKKIILIAVAVLCVVGGVLLLRSCVGSEDPVTTTTTTAPEHVHVPNGTAYDAVWHWTVCAGCDMHLDSEYHDFETVVIAEPTYHEDGKQESHCKTCDHKVTGIVIPMLTHTCDWVLVDEEETVCGENYTYECKLCKDRYVSFDVKQHNFVNYVCTLCDTRYASSGVHFNVNDAEKTVTVSTAYVMDDVLVCEYDLPEGYSFIIDRLFGACTSVIIPAYATEIKSDAFKDCENLKEVVIPASVTKLGNVGNYIEKLVLHPDLAPIDTARISCEKVYLDGDIYDLVELMKRGFDFSVDELYLKREGSYALMERVEYTGESLPDHAFEHMNFIKEVTLTVNEIGSYCFNECQGITKVTLTAEKVNSSFNACNALVEAHINAEIVAGFQRCNQLKRVTLGKRSAYLDGAFSHNPELIYFDSGEGDYICFDEAFTDCPKLAEIYIRKKSCSGLYVPASVRTLTVPNIAGVGFANGGAEYGYKVPLVDLTVTDYFSDGFKNFFTSPSFAYLEALKVSGAFDTGVDIRGERLKLVEIQSSKAFPLYVSGSPELAEITIKGAVSLDLENCPKLTKLAVPEGVYDLRLSGNTALAELTLPKSLRRMGGTFTDALTKVYYGGSLLDWGVDVTLAQKGSNPMQYAEDFFTRDGSTYIRPETLEGDFAYFGKINDYAFYGLKQLKTLKNVYPISIGKYAFAESGLTEFAVGQNDIVIWENAFENCTDLVSFSINAPKGIDCYALKGCTALKNLSINLIGGRPYIANNFLEGCDPLTLSYEGGEYIGSTMYPYAILYTKGEGDAHPDCQYSYESGSYLKDLYEGYFYTTYEDIRYYGTSDNPYEIAESVVGGEKETYTLHADTKTIGDALFAGNTTIMSIILPEKVKSIGADAFKNCTSLERIRLNRNVTYIGAGAFRGCEGLHYVDVQCHDQEDLFNIWFKIEFADQYSTPMRYASSWQGRTNSSNVPVNNIVIPLGTTTLKMYSLSGFNGKLWSVTIPATLTTVEDWALSDSTFDRVYYEGYLLGWMELNCSDFFNLVLEDDRLVSKTRLFIGGEELESLVLDKSIDASIDLDPLLFSTASLASVTVKDGYYRDGNWFEGAVNLKSLSIMGGTISPYIKDAELEYLYLENPISIYLKGTTVKKFCIKSADFLGADYTQHEIFEGCEIDELIINGDTVHIASLPKKAKKITINASNVYIGGNIVNTAGLEELIINAESAVVVAHQFTDIYGLDAITIDCKYFFSPLSAPFADLDNVTINTSGEKQN